MQTTLAMASRREVRDYLQQPLPSEVVNTILEAGRAAGSAMNHQDRRFIVVEEAREAVKAAVTRPTNIDDAQLLVAIVVGSSRFAEFDAGRAAQNMLLAAWDAGVGSCPNAVADHDVLASPLGVEYGERVLVILSFGFPARPVDVDRRTADEWFSRADRLSAAELVSRA
jgi:nitroreductase